MTIRREPNFTPPQHPYPYTAKRGQQTWGQPCWDRVPERLVAPDRPWSVGKRTLGPSARHWWPPSANELLVEYLNNFFYFFFCRLVPLPCSFVTSDGGQKNENISGVCRKMPAGYNPPSPRAPWYFLQKPERTYLNNLRCSSVSSPNPGASCTRRPRGAVQYGVQFNT